MVPRIVRPYVYNNFFLRRKIMSKSYYISTAIAYTSGKPHIGNTYEIVLADAIARFKRILAMISL